MNSTSPISAVERTWVPAQGSAVQGASLLGYAVDAAVATGSASPWWPAGVLGLACSLLFLLRSVRPDASSG